ncbi:MULTISPECIES: hypothetical protein [Halomarina]|uniref:Uncharacterized protein n=2 Tax=Halomarina TaxID=871740 RepID=A0A6B0GLT6_9EURY|nr:MULTISPECIES: hypothetical protein [Halomarina]MWG33733.1 hypothetical protein [Halomarina oriensis]
MDIMVEVGVNEPRTMHYGDEKSRNDFGDEVVRFVNGCTDPGGDFVVDLLPEFDLEATPERSKTECDHCEGDSCPRCDGRGRKRAHVRRLIGDDADIAAAILILVQENHSAQATGRWVRNPDGPLSTATVFVRINEIPVGFADVQVPVSRGSGPRRNAAPLRPSAAHRARWLPGWLTTTPASRSAPTLDVFDRLVDHDDVISVPEQGPNDATLYDGSDVPHSGVVGIGRRITSMWTLVIRQLLPSKGLKG